MFVPGERRTYDWGAIRAFYELGHSPSECQREFSISNGAWYAAVQRGTVLLRVAGRDAPRGRTRAAVAELLSAGLSQAAIARSLGISAPTVSFHARRLGIPARAAAAQRYDWKEIRSYYDAGHSVRECLERFGFSRNAWADAVRRGAVTSRPHLEPLEKVLAAGRPRCRQHVKARLRLAGLKDECCEQCGLSDWRDRPLSLELHHVNGDGQDNRLDNLMLLCPNCHSQTDTWGARNKGRSVMRG
jgi:hypothetical protein